MKELLENMERLTQGRLKFVSPYYTSYDNTDIEPEDGTLYICNEDYSVLKKVIIDEQGNETDVNLKIKTIIFIRFLFENLYEEFGFEPEIAKEIARRLS